MIKIICLTCKGTGFIKKVNAHGAIEKMVCPTCKNSPGEVEVENFPEGYHDAVQKIQTSQEQPKELSMKTII